MVFVDFMKTFDTVGRIMLWQLLRKYGCAEKFTTMIDTLDMGMMSNATAGGEISEMFGITIGVKHVSVMLLSIFLSAMLDETFPWGWHLYTD